MKIKMNIPKFLFYFVLTFPFFQLQSQNSSEDCRENLSIFAESAKIKNYQAAYEPWMSVRTNCPKYSLATFQYGELILKDFIKSSSGEQEKMNYVDDLLKLYDEWAANFPIRKGVNQIGKIYSSKGQAMIDNNVEDKVKIYQTFEYAYNNDINSFSNPKSLAYYFQTAYDLYKMGNSEVPLEVLFNKYEELTERFESLRIDIAKNIDIILKKEESGVALSSKEERNKRIYDTNSNAVGAYLQLIDQRIAKEATCDILIPLYSKSFEANKDNSLWIKRAAGRLDGKECSDDPLFVTLVEQLHSLEPSADSAYYLGILNDKSGNSDQALKYYQESVTLESDNYKKANILYRIAVKFKNSGRKTSSRNYAERALSFQPSMGKAYILIANLYASSANACGDSQFNKRAVYWLAAQTAQKAGRVDASIRKIANRTAASYNGRAPSKTDIFTEGNQGQTVRFSCWIGRSVKVPNL
jgi:tetratricopeptide (TPR) repeat protein